jgi:hypothetical protein
MANTVTRSRKKSSLGKEPILNAMEVAGSSVEGSKYLATQHEKLYDDPIMQGMLNRFSKNTQHKLETFSQSWNGESFDSTGYMNMYANIAVEAAQNLENMGIGTDQGVVLDIAVNSDAEFLRGYSTGGKQLDTPSTASMDELFSAWLISNNLTSQDSIFYESDKNGKIIEEDGQNIRANPDKAKGLISDSEKGFDKYLSSKGINLTIQQHQYPSVEHQAQAKAQTETKVKDAVRGSDNAPAAEGQSTMKTGGR